MLALGLFDLLKGLDFEETRVHLGRGRRCWSPAERSSASATTRSRCARRSGGCRCSGCSGWRVAALATWASQGHPSFDSVMRETGDLLRWQPGPIHFDHHAALAPPFLVDAAGDPLGRDRDPARYGLRHLPAAGRGPRVARPGEPRLAGRARPRARAGHAVVLQAPRRQALLLLRGPRARSSATGSRTACCCCPAIRSGPSRRVRRRCWPSCGVRRRPRAEARRRSAPARGSSAVRGARSAHALPGRRGGHRPRAFSLEGRPIRKVRQSVTRLRKAGYTAELQRSPSSIAETLTQVEAVLERGRKGTPERGFSMAMDSCRRPARRRDAGRARPRRRAKRPWRPALRPVLRAQGDVALVHAPRPGHAQRADGVPRRRGDRALRERGIEEMSLNFAAFAKWMHSPAAPSSALLGKLVRSETRSSRSRACTASTRSSSRAGSPATSSTRARSGCHVPDSPRCGPRASCPSRRCGAAAERRGAYLGGAWRPAR